MGVHRGVGLTVDELQLSINIFVFLWMVLATQRAYEDRDVSLAVWSVVLGLLNGWFALRVIERIYL
jgi:hypothetical protein